MSSEEVQVEPEDLHRKATQIESLVWTSASAQPELVAPDALIVSSVAVTNLAVNARALWAHQQFGKIEGTRLAQTLHNVADAYAQIDQASAQDIAATIDGDGTPLADTTVYPKAVTTPAPPRPPAMPIPKGQPPADQMMFPPDAQRALDAGDHGASLQAVAQLWRSNAQTLEGSARQFEVNSVLWEGAAADAAYAKFTRYRDWLIGLAESWKRLAGEADRIAQAHRTARQDHHPVADEYQQLHDSVMGKPLSPYTYSTMERMAELQARSESLRNAYARDGQPYQITPEEPPNPVVSGVPVTLQDHRHARRADPRSDDSRRGAPSAGNGSSSEAGGGAPRPTQHAATSPAGGSPAATQAPEGNSPAGSPSGGAPSSGAPSGATPGGAPGAGSPGSTAPTHPKPEPTFPRGPSVQPAAHSGAGAGGGGGGAGVPAGPLQPAVSAETVALTPVVAPSAPAPAQGAGGSGGAAMGGGMGGMAPMMHGAQGNTGEKKRNPQLSEDEELYTEDRPWTEPVVGNRARRRGASDDSRKES